MQSKGDQRKRKKGAKSHGRGTKGKKAGAVSAFADYEDYDQDNADPWYDHGWDRHEDCGEDDQYQDAPADY
eukprot:12897168-Prorocentrum_lima.AAC.1